MTTRCSNATFKRTFKFDLSRRFQPQVVRYHSLLVDAGTLPADLRPISWTCGATSGLALAGDVPRAGGSTRGDAYSVRNIERHIERKFVLRKCVACCSAGAGGCEVQHDVFATIFVSMSRRGGSAHADAPTVRNMGRHWVHTQFGLGPCNYPDALQPNTNCRAGTFDTGATRRIVNGRRTRQPAALRRSVPPRIGGDALRRRAAGKFSGFVGRKAGSAGAAASHEPGGTAGCVRFSLKLHSNVFGCFKNAGASFATATLNCALEFVESVGSMSVQPLKRHSILLDSS